MIHANGVRGARQLRVKRKTFAQQCGIAGSGAVAAVAVSVVIVYAVAV